MSTLSVVLPNYNHARWLPRSLAAIIAQADAGTEVLVVDDGSTDDSIEVVERFRRANDCISLIRHERNRGVGAAIATGLEAAAGEFVLVAAADDLVLPGLFARAVAALRANPQAAFFCSGTVLIDSRDRIIGFRPIVFPRATAGYMSPVEMRRAIRSSDNWFVGSSVVYRRDRLAAIGDFDETLGSLADGMANRLLAFRHGFYFDPEMLSAWRRSPDSVSGRTAQSAAESRRCRSLAAQHIRETFPADIRDDYARLFDRRFRFNVVRLRLVWGAGQIDWRALFDLLDLSGLDRTVMRSLGRLPGVSSHLVLMWMALRLRPFGLRALGRAWWRRRTMTRSRRAALQSMVAGSDVARDGHIAGVDPASPPPQSHAVAAAQR
jgi:glycosyltransferase involved in cell wall biosynthesis